MLAEDFEVSIFLTETSTRHSLLTKQKHFRDTGKKDLQSNSQKLMGATNDTAIDVEDAPVIREEDSDDEGLNLPELPAAEDVDSLFVEENEGSRRSKRPRAATYAESSSGESSSGLQPSPKRQKEGADEPIEEGNDDKKKMAMDTTYDGFSIYGRVLCLVVKRKDNKGKQPAKSAGQAMMEDWIVSTQMPPAEDDG
jgi:hypothetical protein